MTGKMSFLLLLFTAAFSLSAAKSDLFDLKVELEQLSPPASNYSGGSAIVPPKITRGNKWLMVQCRYTPPTPKNAAGDLSFLHMDDVEMEVRIIFNSGISVDGKPLLALYTGKVLFWTIRLDGNRHDALMFLPAQLIDRCSAGSLSSPSVMVAPLKNFYVEVTFRQNGAVIGRAYRNVSGGNSSQEKKFQQMAVSVPKELTFEDAIISRENSPWADCYPDRYDAEKKRPVEKR